MFPAVEFVTIFGWSTTKRPSTQQVIRPSAFGAPGYVRLSYALSDDDLAEGLGRWQKFVAAG